jgi:glycosyltransferase involved in cell wall biosynthesis
MEKIIIIKIQGGLGNQMFQYAFGRSLSENLRKILKLDVSGYYQKNRLALQDDTKRTYLLDKFNIHAELASDVEIACLNPLWYKIWKKICGKICGYENPYIFYEKNLTAKKGNYREGFWNSEKYFNTIPSLIRQEFTLKNPLGKEAQEMFSLIEKADNSGAISVSLHVRRSDYISKKVNADFFGACTVEYYQRAFNRITNKKLELFIFSDDIPWVQENLSFPCPIHFVSRPDIADYEEIVLMSACRCHIIANSSFGWWGAWLDPRPDKIVIAPKKWIADPGMSTPDVIPPSWIQIKDMNNNAIHTATRNKKVSIIMPTYNRAREIGEAIQSILAQSYTDWELIIIDDASTDDTEAVVKNYILRAEQASDHPRIRYIRQPKNSGISIARNRGLAEAHGTYIAMLDSDDIWLDSGKLTQQVAFLETHPDYALVGTWLKTMKAKGTIIGKVKFSTTDEKIRLHILRRNQFAQSSVLILKQAITDEGGYDNAYTVNEDYDLWLKIGRKYKFATIPEYMLGYRIHHGNIMRSQRVLAAQSHLEIIRKYHHDYPGYWRAKIKGRIRLLMSYL